MRIKLAATLVAILIAATESLAADAAIESSCRGSIAEAAGKKAASILQAFGRNLHKPNAARLDYTLLKAQDRFARAVTKARSAGGCQQLDPVELGSSLDQRALALVGDVAGPPRPNVIVIITDDQPWHSLGSMPIVQTELVASGTEFTNAFVTTPLCCPSRASFFTGQYAYNHGVFTNTNGAGLFDDSSTIATWLHDAGYRTGLIGKYLNGYGALSPYVPPGWDEWHVFEAPGYYNYRLIENGTPVEYGSAPQDYSTDVLAQKAVEFIESADSRPFFLWLSTWGPHGDAIPAPRHVGSFAGLTPWRPPNYNEADVSDKYFFVQILPEITPETAAIIDDEYQTVLEALQSIDEAVGTIMEALRDSGREHQTLVIFTTDNSRAFGEHRWFGKRCPYAACTRAPLVMHYPPNTLSPRQESRFALNVDVAPLLTELAGITPEIPVDGVSLLPLLEDAPGVAWRQEILGERLQYLETWASLRDSSWLYIEHFDYPPELYDLTLDPWELTNVAGEPANAAVRADMAARLRLIGPPWLPLVPP